MIYYLSVAQVLALHQSQLQRFGGPKGLLDQAALEAAVARPAMTFGGEDLYPDIASKSAALMHFFVMNHPVVDGNKRAGISATELFIMANGYEIRASDLELENLTLAVARGELDIEPLTIWFRQRLAPRD